MKTGMVRSWLRGLLVQASWNYDRMLGLGVGHAMEPLLRELRDAADGARYREAVARGSQFFNAHPYLAGIAIGAQARAECEGLPAEHVRRLRGALVGPLGSLGDKLVWAGALPAAAALGLLLAALTAPLVGAAAFVIAYNIAHLTLRSWALRAGWRHGTTIANALSAPLLQRGLHMAGPAAALAIGVALPPVWEWLVRDLATNARLGVALIAGLGFVLSRWLAPSFGGLRFGLAALLTAFVVGLAWE